MKRLAFLSLLLLLLLVPVPGCITFDVAPPATTEPSETQPATEEPSSTATTITPEPSTPAPQTTSGPKTVKLATINEESGSMISIQPLGTTASNYRLNKDSLCIGDRDSEQSKAFLSFDISAIPQTAIIEEAILDLSDFTVSGNPTYGDMFGGMGDMKVYHHQYGDINDPLRVTMIWPNRLAKLTENGSFREYPLSPWAWDVKNSQDGEPVIQVLVQTGQSRSQFMIEFFTSTNWDTVADMICFNNVTLTIKYTVP